MSDISLQEPHIARGAAASRRPRFSSVSHFAVDGAGASTVMPMRSVVVALDYRGQGAQRSASSAFDAMLF